MKQSFAPFKGRAAFTFPSLLVFQLLLLALCITLGAVSFGSQAAVPKGSSFSVDYIRGEGGVDGVKIAAQYHYGKIFESYFENLNLTFESSVNFWEFGTERTEDTNFVIAVSPIVQYPIGTLAGKPYFLEFGIGFSLLDDTRFAGKDISTHYQFEDRLGIAMRFGAKDQHQLSLRYFHYSNAGLRKPNPGLDFISFSYSRFL